MKFLKCFIEKKEMNRIMGYLLSCVLLFHSAYHIMALFCT